MNLSSSRSHAIFTLHFEKIIQSTNLNDSISGGVGVGVSGCEKNLPTSFKINFIDLAGSERLKKTGATGERFKESVSINSGLLALSKVIMTLSENNPKNYVPYRDSKLTRLLKDSLNGNSITLIVACISACEYNYEETLNTLNYASFAKSIKISPMMNFNFNNFGNNSMGNINKERYEEIINKLKTENFELMRIIERNNIKEDNEFKLKEFANDWDRDKEKLTEKDMEIQRLKNMVKFLKKKNIVRKNFYFLIIFS